LLFVVGIVVDVVVVDVVVVAVAVDGVVIAVVVVVVEKNQIFQNHYIFLFFQRFRWSKSGNSYFSILEKCVFF